MLTNDFLYKNLIPLNLKEQVAFFQRDDVRTRIDHIFKKININPSIKRVNECIGQDVILCDIIKQYMNDAELIRDEDIRSYPMHVLEFDETLF